MPVDWKVPKYGKPAYLLQPAVIPQNSVHSAWEIALIVVIVLPAFLFWCPQRVLKYEPSCVIYIFPSSSPISTTLSFNHKFTGRTCGAQLILSLNIRESSSIRFLKFDVIVQRTFRLIKYSRRWLGFQFTFFQWEPCADIRLWNGLATNQLQITI